MTAILSNAQFEELGYEFRTKSEYRNLQTCDKTWINIGIFTFVEQRALEKAKQGTILKLHPSHCDRFLLVNLLKGQPCNLAL